MGFQNLRRWKYLTGLEDTLTAMHRLALLTDPFQVTIITASRIYNSPYLRLPQISVLHTRFPPDHFRTPKIFPPESDCFYYIWTISELLLCTSAPIFVVISAFDNLISISTMTDKRAEVMLNENISAVGNTVNEGEKLRDDFGYVWSHFAILIGYSLTKNMWCRNPLASIAKEALIHQVDSFVNTFGFVEKRDIFIKAALVAQNPTQFQTLLELNDNDRHTLNDELNRKWHQPKSLWFTIVVCSIGAAVQGWDQVSKITLWNS